jgi:hypothetical protein
LRRKLDLTGKGLIWRKSDELGFYRVGGIAQTECRRMLREFLDQNSKKQ